MSLAVSCVSLMPIGMGILIFSRRQTGGRAPNNRLPCSKYPPFVPLPCNSHLHSVARMYIAAASFVKTPHGDTAFTAAFPVTKTLAAACTIMLRLPPPSPTHPPLYASRLGRGSLPPLLLLVLVRVLLALLFTMLVLLPAAAGGNAPRPLPLACFSAFASVFPVLGPFLPYMPPYGARSLPTTRAVASVGPRGFCVAVS